MSYLRDRAGKRRSRRQERRAPPRRRQRTMRCSSQRRYLLNHGDGSNLTYLNGEVVMSAAELASGAMIELGETTLRFQGFCSADFDWPDVDD